LGYENTLYKLDGNPSQGFGEIAMDYNGDKWRVYSFERGQENDMALFERKRDAVYYFFLKLMIIKGSLSYPHINFKNMPK
jgi:hypothetical protein